MMAACDVRGHGGVRGRRHEGRAAACGRNSNGGAWSRGDGDYSKKAVIYGLQWASQVRGRTARMAGMAALQGTMASLSVSVPGTASTSSFWDNRLSTYSVPQPEQFR